MTYLYIFRSHRHPFRYKIGISNNPQRRRREVAKHNPCSIVLYLPLFGAYRLEQLFLRTYRRLGLQCRKMRHTGKEEWVYTLFPLVPMLVMVGAFLTQLSLIFLIAISLWHGAMSL